MESLGVAADTRSLPVAPVLDDLVDPLFDAWSEPPRVLILRELLFDAVGPTSEAGTGSPSTTTVADQLDIGSPCTPLSATGAMKEEPRHEGERHPQIGSGPRAGSSSSLRVVWSHLWRDPCRPTGAFLQLRSVVVPATGKGCTPIPASSSSIRPPFALHWQFLLHVQTVVFKS